MFKVTEQTYALLALNVEVMAWTHSQIIHVPKHMMHSANFAQSNAPMDTTSLQRALPTETETVHYVEVNALLEHMKPIHAMSVALETGNAQSVQLDGTALAGAQTKSNAL